MRKYLGVFAGVCLFFGIGFHAFGQLSTVGEEFWVGFMDNNRVPPGNNGAGGAPDFAVLIVTANEDASGTIEYQGQTVNFSIAAGQQYTLRIPSEDLDLLHRNSGVRENKGIYISSSGKIAVHAYNERFRSADGTVILPVGALGTDYYITSHYETLTANVNYNGNINDESTLLVVATEDDTEVEITSTVPTIGGGAVNAPFTISLDRGQSYQLKAKDDLTGTRVRVIGENADECKKIAVFGGNKWTSVGNCGEANDHLFQQAYPVNTWGTSFVHVALSGRTSGELVKVVAAEDGTEVRVNGAVQGTVNQGEWLALEFGINESGKIETSKPASVTVFAKSQACNEPNSPNAFTGDPFMITYSPSEQFLKTLTFNSLNLPSIENHYVNVVIKAGTQDSMILDGQSINNRFQVLPGDPDFLYARINISQGVHRLSNPEGFAAYAYGFGNLESYGYAAGAALDNLNFETEAQYEFDVLGDNVACLNVEGDWVIEADNPDFTYFVWNFGDGTPPQEGKEVLHTFSQPGEYVVTVLAALSPNSCDQQENITFNVTVTETAGEVIGSSSACPEVEQLLYSFEGPDPFSRVEFIPNGGEVVEFTDETAVIRWGEANDDAFLEAIPYSENGCPGEPVIFPVVINQRLEAEEIQGSDQVCFDPQVSHFYSVPQASSGRNYDWSISGGQILSGQGTGEVEVSWDQAGVTGTLSYEVSSLIDSSCEGVSAPISVRVEEEFLVQPTAIVPVSCFGSESGSITLDISGGLPPYTVEWSHSSGLNDALAEDLPAGLYSVKVIDQLGCERILEDLEITQPDVLAVESLSPVGVSCFGKPDGQVDLEISGGVPPYSLDFDGGIEFSGILSLSDLPQGMYDWEVTDSNGCLIELDFEVTSPAPPQVDVRLERPACPGGSDGELFASPVGSTGPFVYTWDFESTMGDQLVGVPKGEYAVSVTDGNGCVSLGVGEVTESAPEVRLPTGYYPERDQDLYQAISNCDLSFELWVYDRWGQLVYSGSEGWDGMVSGAEAPMGTYSYQVQYRYMLEDQEIFENKSGAFALIR
ncbi:PKD domain-containing protein [Algoriphagus hitonicola]|uniref:SprB repeat-containing protein n=1 Tax=Algoriphagus hitonicola TaxID=435880 RepID=A0A1I2WVW3_9BACT|nr:PKD domain-containing protein [Algoriphagus hitonicola]SFH04526.1 SprB repeat-containing protein [Algoriphagus hitonicola]